jgi:hypothetical protein
MRYRNDSGEHSVRRGAFIISLILSLFLCAATAVLWVRSYPGITFRFGPNRWEMTTVTVREGNVTWHGPCERNSPIVFDYGLSRVPAGLMLLWTSPFLFHRLRNSGGLAVLALLIHGIACILSTWLAFPIIFVFDVILAIHIVREAVSPARRTSRANNGLCETCGYDLRATPGRCPECGSVPSKS